MSRTRQTSRGHANAPGPRGFTLMEMLMSMAILAMLMTAIGAAFDGAMGSYRENEKIASATQLGRMILARMTREVRTCGDLNSTATMLDITPPAPVDDTDPTRIVYELASGVLTRRITVQGENYFQELLGGSDGTTVETFTVLREVDGEGAPVSATIRLVLGVDGRTFALTTSGVLRGAQYQ